jgi:hypothetical protein
MAWKIDLSSNALKQLRKLDKPIANRIPRTAAAISSLLNPQLMQRCVQSRLANVFPHRGHFHCVSHHAAARYTAIHTTSIAKLASSPNLSRATRNPRGTNPTNSTTSRFRRAT